MRAPSRTSASGVSGAAGSGRAHGHTAACPTVRTMTVSESKFSDLVHRVASQHYKVVSVSVDGFTVIMTLKSGRDKQHYDVSATYDPGSGHWRHVRPVSGRNGAEHLPPGVRRYSRQNCKRGERKRTAIGCARVSVDRDDKVSPDMQRHAIEDTAKGNDGRLVGVEIELVRLDRWCH